MIGVASFLNRGYEPAPGGFFESADSKLVGGFDGFITDFIRACERLSLKILYRRTSRDLPTTR